MERVGGSMAWGSLHPAQVGSRGGGMFCQFYASALNGSQFSVCQKFAAGANVDER